MSIDEDLTPRGVFSKIRSRVSSITDTTRLVWRRRRTLLSERSAKLEAPSDELVVSPPVRYFTVMLALAGSIESLLFPPLPAFELPPGASYLSKVFTLLPEVTIFTTVASVLASAALPWMMARLVNDRIPFAVLIRAYAYQQGGGIIAPMAILLNFIIYATCQKGRWQPWFAYSFIFILPFTVFGAFWVSRQVRDEGYKQLPVRAGATLTMLLIGSAGVFGIRPIGSFRAVSDTMYPAIQRGDVVLTNQLVYRWRSPKRGEIVVVGTPAGQPIISRIVGIPGDHVEVRDGKVRINLEQMDEWLVGYSQSGPKYDEKLALLCGRGEGAFDCGAMRFRVTSPFGRSYDVVNLAGGSVLAYTDPVTLGADQYYLVSDNRDQALDSRTPVAEGGLGIVSKNEIVGPVYARRLPLGSPAVDNLQ